MASVMLHRYSIASWNTGQSEECMNEAITVNNYFYAYQVYLQQTRASHASLLLRFAALISVYANPNRCLSIHIELVVLQPAMLEEIHWLQYYNQNQQGKAYKGAGNYQY